MKRKRFTAERRKLFLDVLATSGIVSSAAVAAGIGRATAYRHRQQDTGFADAWAEAEQIAADALEKEAWRRAVEGVPEPVMSGGRLVTVERMDGTRVPLTIRRYSDTLLIALLKARRPEKFRERDAVQLTGANDRPVQVENVRDRIASKLARIAAATSRGESASGVAGTLAAMSAGGSRMERPDDPPAGPR